MQFESTILKSVEIVRNKRIQAISEGLLHYAAQKNDRIDYRWTLLPDFYKNKDQTENAMMLNTFGGVKPNVEEFEMVMSVLTKNGYFVAEEFEYQFGSPRTTYIPTSKLYGKKN